MNENKQYVSKINGYYIKDGDVRDTVDTLSTTVNSTLGNLQNIYVLTGTQTLLENDQDITQYPYKLTSFSVNYPTGYTQNNTYVVAFHGSIDNNTRIGGYGVGYTPSLAQVGAILPRNIILNEENINIQIYNPTPAEHDYNYKILLMRIDPEEQETTNGGE